jgi:hypothetical protein
MKFHRPAGDLQAYLYRDAGSFKASLFMIGKASDSRSREPLHTFENANELGLEAEVRAWVESHYPKGARSR